MRRRSKFEPVVFCDPFAMIGQRKIAVELAGDGTISCLEWFAGDYCVRNFSIEEPSLGIRHVPIDAPVAGQAASLKISALEHGATSEAIRLLGLICPLTKQEEAVMADKLKTKGSLKAGDKEALKGAAKDAPVGKKPRTAPEPKAEKAEASKKRGNPEALAKARETRKDKGPDNRKIKALIKAKDIKAREGSYRREMVEALLSSKTVQEFYETKLIGGKKPTSGDLAYAVKDELVTVG